MPAVSDTSPIFNLACINHLHLLRDQFGDVWIPEAVQDELRSVPDAIVRNMIDESNLAGWLKTRRASNASLISLLALELHPGESEAIALALEMKARVLLDERDGRRLARQLRLHLTGVLGVLLRAKQTGRIPAIKPEIEALRSRAGFFIAPDLERAVLVEAHE